MAHPLEQKLVALRRRARPMAAIRGLCIAAALLLCAAIALGAFDYFVRIQDRGLRLIASLAVFSLLIWAAYRHVFAVFRARLGNSELAALVERRFPILGDRLQSAVEFLRTADDDAAAGSAALRRKVVAQAAAEAAPLDFSAVLDARPTCRALAMLFGAGAFVGVLVLLNPSASHIAMVRLANPFSDAPWPQTTHLLIRGPVDRIARGDDFQVEAVDARGARLPAEVRIHYRLAGADGGTVEESERMRFVEGAMIARRENVQRSFSYRVEGGDDRSMPWHDVEVAEPPTVEAISINLVPPSFTGWPPRSSERRIRAPAGTLARIEGRASKPLASARLCMEGGRPINAILAADGLAFRVDFTIENSGAYWFELIDREGLHGNGGDRWEIFAMPDAAPSVVIERPTANLFVTPQATAPISLAVKDDLAISNISLMFQTAMSSPESSMPLYVGPAEAPRQSTWDSPGEIRKVDYRWNLALLNLQPGSQVSFFAAASDYRGQLGKSDSRRLIVVAPDELQDRLADREKLIAAELERALRMQRECRKQVEALRIRLGQSRRPDRSDQDRLQAAEHSQREAVQLLARRGEGVPIHALALLADMDNNGIDGAESRRRMNSLLDELERLEREVVPELGRELTAAIKAAQVARENRDASAASVVHSLTVAAKYQDAIAAVLERLVGELARSDGNRRFRRELAELLRDQEETARRTTEAGRRTLGRETRDLAPQDAEELASIALEQRELARRLDRSILETDRASVELRKTDPAAADVLADALNEARRLAISGRMRDAGERIERNQIGQAAAGQKQIAGYLRAVLDILADRSGQKAGESDGVRFDQLEDDVKHLRQRQELALQEAVRLDKLKRSAGDLTREQALALRDLVRVQRTLQSDTSQLGERLVGAEAIQAALAGVAVDMGAAADAFDRRQIGQQPQAAQRRAMQKLDLLLGAIESAQKTDGQKTDSNNNGDKPDGKPGDQPGDKPGDKPPAAGQLRPPEDQAARRADAAETRAAMQRLWGALPERERERMMQSAVEEFAPKYELMIEDYFRRLSEENARPE